MLFEGLLAEVTVVVIIQPTKFAFTLWAGRDLNHNVLTEMLLVRFYQIISILQVSKPVVHHKTGDWEQLEQRSHDLQIT